MPTATINAPFSFAQSDTAGLTHAYVFARQELLEAMTDLIDPIQTGMVGLKGDLAGSGSDTLRINEVDDIGFSRRMSALVNETDAITPSAYTLGYTDLTVAMYGLSHEETYHQQVLGMPGNSLTLEQLIAYVPQSFLATLRYLACVTGATISSTVGSATTYLSVDDHLDLATEIRSTPGAMARGNPHATIDPAAFDKLIRSYRTEPAFQASVEAYKELTRLQAGQSYVNFAGVGIDIHITDDVQQSGGGYQGFCQSPGGIGWGRASTGKIRPSGTGTAMYLPEFGLFIQEVDRGQNGKAAYEARSWMGTALGSSNVFFQRRLISKV